MSEETEEYWIEACEELLNEVENVRTFDLILDIYEDQTDGYNMKEKYMAMENCLYP